MTVWGWIKLGFGVVVTAIVAAFGWSATRRAEAEGAAKERAKGDLDRVSKMEKEGDAGGLRDDILGRIK